MVRSANARSASIDQLRQEICGRHSNQEIDPFYAMIASRAQKLSATRVHGWKTGYLWRAEKQKEWTRHRHSRSTNTALTQCHSKCSSRSHNVIHQHHCQHPQPTTSKHHQKQISVLMKAGVALDFWTPWHNYNFICMHFTLRFIALTWDLLINKWYVQTLELLNLLLAFCSHVTHIPQKWNDFFIFYGP